MKQSHTLVFGLLVCLVMASSIEAIGRIYPHVNPRLYRGRRDVEEVVKRGWLADKWSAFSDRVDNSIQEADKAVNEFLDTIRYYEKLSRGE